MRTRQFLLTRLIILGFFLFSIVILFQTHPLSAQEAKSGDESFQKVFSGTIGDYPIMMRLIREGNTLSGDCIYTKYGVPIPLKGEINTKGEFHLYELTEKGVKVAEFKGWLSASSNRIKGTWIKGTTTLPFKAELTSLQAYTESKAAWKMDLAHLSTTDDVVVTLDYDTGGPWTFGGPEDNRVSLEGGEKFLVLPVEVNNHYEYSIFQSRGSHWYGGTPLTVKKSPKRYVLSYIGLKTSEVTSLGDLTVEIAVEFGAGRNASFYIPREGFLARVLNLFVSMSYACGPSMYVREVGTSKLVFFKEANEIRWYELTTPIPLYNMPSGYCDAGDIKKMMEEESYSEAEAKDYCARLSAGEARMHIDYIPTTPGRLIIEVAAIVLKDAKGNYWQTKLIQGSNRAYRVNLVPSEKGSLQYVYDKETATLLIELKNTGQSPIRLDEVSLDTLARSGTYGESLLDGFSLGDAEGRSVRTLSFQEIQNKLKGKTILPDQSLHLPLFSISKLPTKAVYCPIAEFVSTSSKYKVPETQGRIISWLIPSWNVPHGLINGRKKKILTIDNNYVLFYVNQDLGVDLMKLRVEEGKPYSAAHINYRQVLPTADSWLYKATLSASKFMYHQTRSHESSGFEWGLFLEESSAQYLAKTSEASVVSRGKDYYGNNLTRYKRGNVTGFIVDRSFKCFYTNRVCAQSVLFEIPSAWTKDEKLMAHLLWMIKMNVVYP